MLLKPVSEFKPASSQERSGGGSLLCNLPTLSVLFWPAMPADGLYWWQGTQEAGEHG